MDANASLQHQDDMQPWGTYLSSVFRAMSVVPTLQSSCPRFLHLVSLLYAEAFCAMSWLCPPVVCSMVFASILHLPLFFALHCNICSSHDSAGSKCLVMSCKSSSYMSDIVFVVQTLCYAKHGLFIPVPFPIWRPQMLMNLATFLCDLAQLMDT